MYEYKSISSALYTSNTTNLNLFLTCSKIEGFHKWLYRIHKKRDGVKK